MHTKIQEEFMFKAKLSSLLIILSLFSLFLGSCSGKIPQNLLKKRLYLEDSIVIMDAAGRQVVLAELPEKIAVTRHGHLYVLTFAFICSRKLIKSW